MEETDGELEKLLHLPESAGRRGGAPFGHSPLGQLCLKTYVPAAGLRCWLGGGLMAWRKSSQLRAATSVERFVFLLGGSDGEPLFGP